MLRLILHSWFRRRNRHIYLQVNPLKKYSLIRSSKLSSLVAIFDTFSLPFRFPLNVFRSVTKWEREKIMPWERKFCRERESLAVREKVLPWERKFCRETESFAVREKFCRDKKVLPWEESFAVREKVLPWERKFCRETESFAVREKVLPWEKKFCRERESFAVTPVGHRSEWINFPKQD